MSSTRLAVGVVIATLSVQGSFGENRTTGPLARATELFGPRLTEHDVFKLDEKFVVWVITATDGALLSVIVGPKSYYSSEFPGQTSSSKIDVLSESQYEDALSRVSELQDIGELKQKYYREMPGYLGPLQTDEFDKAFVEKVLRQQNSSGGISNDVWQFTVHYVEQVSGSPKQTVTSEDEPSQVCFGSEWFYVKGSEVKALTLGRWITFMAAGPSSVSRECVRAAPLFDADGFTIEEPQTETVVVRDPYKVRTLTGHVSIGGQPLKGVNVEVLPAGSKTVLRAKTNANGKFVLTPARKGIYKFKVTKDGFKALTGTILVDPAASATLLSFELQVGT